MNVIPRPGLVLFAPHPRCPQHGQMRYNGARDRWECRGYDGEGCDHAVPSEALNWQPLGTVEGFTFSVRLTP